MSASLLAWHQDQTSCAIKKLLLAIHYRYLQVVKQHHNDADISDSATLLQVLLGHIYCALALAFNLPVYTLSVVPHRPVDPVLDAALNGRGGGMGSDSSLCMATPPMMPMDDR